MANLRITELDFDTIKTNLKTYLQSQSEFTDYDFEGSGLSVLLDVLSYNTHYNAYLANMLVNEMFLDSSVKRSSAVSIAKHLGYTPTSARGARATVNITVNNPTGLPSVITLNRYTPFTSTIDGTSYTFLNINELSTNPIGGVYTFEEVELVEGTPLEFSYTVANPGPAEKYVIPNDLVDTSTLLVTVQASSSNVTTTTFTLATDITGLTSTSPVFFLEENPLGRYEIFFGDGVIGQKLTAGNIVRIRYLSVNGSGGNVSESVTQNFAPSTTIAGSNDINIEVVNNSTGGAAKENIDSIKFNAPRYNSARNRAVTAADYEALIKSVFTGAESVSVWGGEDNDPPIYGKVLISLKPFEGFTITQETKDGIRRSFLDNKKVLAISPEFVDPVFYHVNLTVNANYISTTTTQTSSQIASIIRTTITNYFSNELQKFNKDFNKSKLTRLILQSNPSINSVLFVIKLQRRLFVALNNVNTFTDSNVIKFKNAIKPGSVSTSRFFITAADGTSILASMTDIPQSEIPNDAGSGTLRIINAGTGAIIFSSIGTVNYGTGDINITGFTPTAFPAGINDFRITCNIQESSHNLIVERNEILVIDDSTTNVANGREAGLTINVSAAIE